MASQSKKLGLLKDKLVLKNCDFCGKFTCKDCLPLTKPFPENNADKSKRGSICLKCNKKFLYRDLVLTYRKKLRARSDLAQEHYQVWEQEEKEMRKAKKALEAVQQERRAVDLEMKQEA